MDMDTTQKELDRQLYLVSTALEPDLERVEELLKLGADPLGIFDEDDLECALDELFIAAQDLESAERLPGMIELFLRYGMNIDDSEIDVLHTLTWVRNEYGMKTLQLLMDAGMSADDADYFAKDLIGDILQFEADCYDPDTDYGSNPWPESLDYAARMILLLSSYEQVFEGSEYIRLIVNAQHEEASAFRMYRNWTDYRCDVTFRDYGEYYPDETGKKHWWHLGAAAVYDIRTGKEIRKLKLIGDLDVGRLEKTQIPDELQIWL